MRATLRLAIASWLLLAVGLCQAQPAPAPAHIELLGGSGVRVRSGGKEVAATRGLPLAASDELVVPPGQFVVVRLGNGYLVKVDEDTTLEVSELAHFGAPPAKDSVAAQLDRLLTVEEKGRAERVAGTQARLAAAQSVAPQAAPSPPSPPRPLPARATPTPPTGRVITLDAQPIEARPEAQEREALDREAQARAKAASSAAERVAEERASAAERRAAAKAAAAKAAAPKAGASKAAPSPSSAPRRDRDLEELLGGVGDGKAGAGGAKAAGGYKAAASSAPAEGALDRGTILAVIRAHDGEVRACYERALRERPGLAGQLVVTFSIAPGGKVTEAELKSSTVAHEALEKCVLDRVRSWQFPKHEGVVRLSFPFSFQAPQ